MRNGEKKTSSHTHKRQQPAKLLCFCSEIQIHEHREKKNPNKLSERFKVKREIEKEGKKY